MKKLLSLSLALVMMLSCVLGQAVLVGAADAVNCEDAPYAGVYEVTSDKAVTLSNEIGSTLNLSAGATGYIYLVKGANKMNISDTSANVTFNQLANNGLDYLDQVNLNLTFAPSSISEMAVSGIFTESYGVTDYGTYVSFGTDGYIVVPVTAAAAGVYLIQINFVEAAANSVYVETDTGFYGVINQQADRAGWNELHQGTHSVGQQDVEILYLREGVNYITFKNVGDYYPGIAKIKPAKTGTLTSLADYNWQLNKENLKVVANDYVAPGEPEVPVTPITIAYEAPLAGVYEVSSDADVTISNDFGSSATLSAGDSAYIYLIKGVNKIETTNEDAILTFTQLENNGSAYLDQVDVDLTFAPSSISEMDVSGIYTESNGVVDYGTYVSFGADGYIVVPVTAAAAGVYLVQINFVEAMANSVYVETDTGFYGIINQQADRAGWNELHQGTHSVGQQDLELLFLREGVNYITFKNVGDYYPGIAKIKLAKTGSLTELADYNWQLNLENLKPVAPEAEPILAGTGVNVAAGELAFFGKVGADYLDQAYGVIIDGKDFFGAKDGDTVSDGNEGTTTFTFGGWDGTFEIILQNITEKGTAGEKTYRFFVGENYTDEATVTVE